MTTLRTFAGEIRCTTTRRREAWRNIRGAALIVVAIALWVWFLAGVAAPLGAALARVAGREPAAASATCRVPPDVLASATHAAARPDPCR